MFDLIPLQFVPKEVRPILATLKEVPEIAEVLKRLLNACVMQDDYAARRELVSLMITIKRVGLTRLRGG